MAKTNGRAAILDAIEGAKKEPVDDLEKAKALIQADLQRRAEGFAKDFEEIKKKWGMNLVPNHVIVPLQ